MSAHDEAVIQTYEYIKQQYGYTLDADYIDLVVSTYLDIIAKNQRKMIINFKEAKNEIRK